MMRGVLVLALAAGCRVVAPFPCERDDQCTSGAGGRCEPTGFCSFTDGDCPSGRRYHDAAGQYAGVCTALMVDARPIDAPFDPTKCPAGYGIALPSTSRRPRVIACSDCR